MWTQEAKTLRFRGCLTPTFKWSLPSLPKITLTFVLKSYNLMLSAELHRFSNWRSGGGGGGGENRITYCALFKWSLVSRASFFQGSALGFHYYISYQPIICKWLIPNSETYNVKYINYTDRETKRRRGDMEMFPKDSPSAPAGGAEWSKRGGGEEEVRKRVGGRGKGNIYLHIYTYI